MSLWSGNEYFRSFALGTFVFCGLGSATARDASAVNVGQVSALSGRFSMAIAPLANREKEPFVGAWTAATNNSCTSAVSNYLFRVSAADELVDAKLLDYALMKSGAKKIGLMVINNSWGESNEVGLEHPDVKNGDIEPVGTEKFENVDVDMKPQLGRQKDSGAKAIVLVITDSAEAQTMKSQERAAWSVT